MILAPMFSCGQNSLLKKMIVWKGMKGVYKVSHEKWNQLLLFSLSHVQLFVTPWTAAHQVSLSFTMP